MTGSSRRTARKPGLQNRWRYVVDSLESIIPIYEVGSSRIALFSDRVMREEVVRFAVMKGSVVLDLGSGPGTMAKMVSKAGGVPVLVDASRKMLLSAPRFERLQSTFEHLPFRSGAFDAVVAGFALRDSRDLQVALGEVSRVLSTDGRFSFCDLGKSRSKFGAMAVALYLALIVPIIGLLSGGRAGLAFGSLYDTYLLTLDNDTLAAVLRRYFSNVRVSARMLGGSIVATCTRRSAVS